MLRSYKALLMILGLALAGCGASRLRPLVARQPRPRAVRQAARSHERAGPSDSRARERCDERAGCEQWHGPEPLHTRGGEC